MSDVRLILGDAITELRLLPDASADCVITDPPYNVGIKYGSTDDRRDDYERWCTEWFAQCERVSGGLVCICPGNVNVAMWCRIKPPRWTLCWWKPAAMGRSPVGFCNWEPMLLYGKPRGDAKSDVVRACIKPDDSLSGHPCPKPLEWGKGFVELLTQPGDLVLDPFVGSGTTGVACVHTGRRFIGVEICKEYYEIARKRIAEAQYVPPLFREIEQPDLFTEPTEGPNTA